MDVKPQNHVAEGTARIVGWVVGFVVVSATIGGIRTWWANTHYSSDFDSSFLSNCEAQGAGSAYCGCALAQVHDRYTPQQASQVLYSGSPVVTEIAGYCANQ